MSKLRSSSAPESERGWCVGAPFVNKYTFYVQHFMLHVDERNAFESIKLLNSSNEKRIPYKSLSSDDSFMTFPLGDVYARIFSGKIQLRRLVSCSNLFLLVLRNISCSTAMTNVFFSFEAPPDYVCETQPKPWRAYLCMHLEYLNKITNKWRTS